MIDATLNLTKMHCNLESDFFGAEPYLWTLFFFSDLNTISGSSGLVSTHTPHQTSTTRGMYPNGIEADDDITVPLSMGGFDITLDNGGGLVQPLIGCLFVLIDERNTDADAIKAGHNAFGISAHKALNDFVAAKIFDDDKTPTPAELKAMTDYITNAVTAAIKDKLSWWDILDQQDRFIGSGSKVYSETQISDIAGEDGGVDQFVVKIRAERTVQNPSSPTSTGTILIDDYDLFGTLRVRQVDPAPDPDDPKKDLFVKAVQYFQAVKATIVGLEEDISCAKGEARQELLAQLRHTQKVTLKASLLALGRTRRACGTLDQNAPRHLLWCKEDNCCDAYANELFTNCRNTTNFGDTYCREFADYWLERCRNPNNPLPLLVLPLAPAARK